MKLRCIIAVITFVCISACSQARYTEKHNRVDVTDGIQREVTVRVLAEAGEWLNSGVVVHAGKPYRIEAHGKWHGGPICGWTGPDGIGSSKMCFFNIIPGWSISSLIARIGENGETFAVGNEYTFVASRSGILMFHINEPESSCTDNQGFVTAKISSPQLAQDIIDVKIIGFDNGVKTNKQQDYREAVLNAKAQAIERAGVEVKSTSKVKDFQLAEDYIETRSQASCCPISKSWTSVMRKGARIR
ncbi:MAG: hypothetical protein K4571_09280 [Deltaproteobacteria bacterium]